MIYAIFHYDSFIAPAVAVLVAVAFLPTPFLKRPKPPEPPTQIQPPIKDSKC